MRQVGSHNNFPQRAGLKPPKQRFVLAKVARMSQRTTRKQGKRRGLRTASPPNRPSGQLIRAWLRLWLPFMVVAVLMVPTTCAFGAPRTAAGSHVAVTADVRPTVRLSLDEDGYAVSANVPWTVTFLHSGTPQACSGTPTAHERLDVSASAATRVTFVAEELPAR